jgi:hypothetical protein
MRGGRVPGLLFTTVDLFPLITGVESDVAARALSERIAPTVPDCGGLINGTGFSVSADTDILRAVCAGELRRASRENGYLIRRPAVWTRVVSANRVGTSLVTELCNRCQHLLPSNGSLWRRLATTARNAQILMPSSNQGFLPVLVGSARGLGTPILNNCHRVLCVREKRPSNYK